MLCVICSCYFRDYDKKSKAICADHPYSKRKAKDDSGEKSDQDNDSSADEAPATKKVKVDTRMVTNQRTGVPVIGSSASDDSCQSQPAKTPPHSAGGQLPSTSTPTPPVASTTMTKPEKSSTPFSMDNILRDVINKDLLDEGAGGKKAKDATMPPTKGGILSKLEELDNKDKEKRTEGTAQESASEDNAWDISVEIIDFIITDALKICEVRKRKISMQIVDSIIDNAIDQSEERRKNKEDEKTRDDVDKDVSIIEISDSDVEEISKNAQKERDAPVDEAVAETETMETQEEPSEKNEESENLAKALLQELKELSGETGGALNVEEKPVIIQDAEEAEDAPEDAKIPEEEKTTGGNVKKTNTEETEGEEISQAKLKEEEIKEKVVTDDVISIDDDDNEIETEKQTDTTKHDTKQKKDDNSNDEKDEAAKDDGKDNEAEGDKKNDEAKGDKDDEVKDDKDDEAQVEKEDVAKGEKDEEAKGEKDEDVRDDTSQDSTAEALERLTSELMFLNESLFESASESVPDSTNVEMEWEDTEAKPETVTKEEMEKEIADENQPNKDEGKPSEPRVTPKEEPHLKKEVVEDDSETSGSKRQTEGVPDTIPKKEIEEQPGKMPESRSATAIVKEKTQALSVIGMEYASSVTSESDVEDRISSSWIKKSPLAKILESSREGDGIKREIGQSNEQMTDLNNVAKCEKEAKAKQIGDGNENVADEEKVKDEEKVSEKSPTTCLNNDNKDKERPVDAETGEAVKSEEKEMKDPGETTTETVGRTEEAMDAETKQKTEETKTKELDDDKGKDASKEKEDASKIPTGEEKSVGKEKDGECSTTTQVEEKELLDLCLKGLTLCLKRFPQHFKSLYRMAYVYYHSKDHRVSQRGTKSEDYLKQ